MRLDIKIGDRSIRPTENEQTLGLAAVGALVLGLVTDSKLLKLGGAVVLAGVGYSVWEEAALFVQPDTMNSYFQTNGATSALGPRGPGSYDTGAELGAGSYETSAAAAPVLAGVDHRRRRRR